MVRTRDLRHKICDSFQHHQIFGRVKMLNWEHGPFEFPFMDGRGHMIHSSQSERSFTQDRRRVCAVVQRDEVFIFYNAIAIHATKSQLNAELALSLAVNKNSN